MMTVRAWAGAKGLCWCRMNKDKYSNLRSSISNQSSFISYIQIKLRLMYTSKASDFHFFLRTYSFRMIFMKEKMVSTVVLFAWMPYGNHSRSTLTVPSKLLCFFWNNIIRRRRSRWMWDIFLFDILLLLLLFLLSLCQYTFLLHLWSQHIKHATIILYRIFFSCNNKPLPLVPNRDNIKNDAHIYFISSSYLLKSKFCV